MQTTAKRYWCTAMMGSALLCGCGSQPEIKIPLVEGSEAAADDADQLPVYDRAHYRSTLPEDGRCRIRYTADYDYEVFAGNRPISERTSPTDQYAAQEATRFAAEGRCRIEPEPCAIVQLRSGYTITIAGDRLNPRTLTDWEELARHVNDLYRHDLCTAIE